MGLILDTSVLIEVERQKINFNLLPDQDVYISAITVSELLVGVYRANTPERRLKRAAFVEYMIQTLTALPFREEEAKIHAHIYSELLAEKMTVDSHDLLIAATALSFGYAILTLNQKDFLRIPGLTVLSPQTLSELL